ncbi:GntR family transcriptional regulator [Microbacterium resistens]|uniref:GntR family transcriptional regulator n=1 Tax=Microbacterium resistens TaxID=156977 RepID=UPI00082EADD6|nr:GntR family transcriptional regulator [Microbacterium resistens]MBW1639153.1 GntR family transcriptional regulator [Microbacterium resistens]
MALRNEPLGDQVARVLRRQILSGERRPGDLLIEKSLSEEFGTSRGPVRDALAQLAEDDLIAASGRSYRILEVTGADIEEIYDLRFLLERHALARAARTGADLRLAREAIAQMDRAATRSDGTAFGLADLAFHRAFPHALGQRRLLSAWLAFERTLRTLMEVNPHPMFDSARAVDLHRELLRAVEEGDPVWEELLRAHLDEARDRFVARYASEAAQTP